MLPNQDVNVVRHDGTGGARVALLINCSLESRGDLGASLCVKGEQGMAQYDGRLLVELTNLPAGRLDFLPPVVQLAKFGDDVSKNL